MGFLAGLIVVSGCVAGVALTVLMLPGIWVMIGIAVTVDLFWRPELFSTWTLAIAVTLGVLAEVLELVASAAGARRAKGSRAAAVWSVVGGIVGGIVGTAVLPIPVVGTIVGAVVGAGLGAGLAERSVAVQGWSDSWRVGTGAAKGRLVSMIIKLSLAVLIGLLLTVALFIS